jgi:ADP-heptose:LPS heptosyltransferase
VGIGDEIMVTGEVKRRAGSTRKRFAIRDPRTTTKWHRWHDIWQGNSRIARPGEPFEEFLDNFGGWRPYIAGKSQTQWKWRPYVPEPGEIFLTDEDLSISRAAMGTIVIQPTIKPGASPNKNWGLVRWQELVDARPDIPWLQIGAGGERRLRGVDFLQTNTFREACGVLTRAQGAVLHEGGLHHAAAALGVKAVVIFGSYIGPRCTGYASHRNIFVDSGAYPLGCGMRVTCPHCSQGMKAITPNVVLKELETILA